VAGYKEGNVEFVAAEEEMVVVPVSLGQAGGAFRPVTNNTRKEIREW
jgi:hypothetical protein